MRTRPSQRELKAERAAAMAGRAALELASAQIGDTPAARAEWLLRFVKMDLAAAPTVKLGYELRALGATLIGAVRLTRTLSPMPAAELRGYQEQLASGIKAALSEGGAEWALPPITYRVSRVPAPPWHIGLQQYADLGSKGGEGPTILHAARQALMGAASRLRTCRAPECAHPLFVAKDAREIYCSEKCSMRVRNRQRRRLKRA